MNTPDRIRRRVWQAFLADPARLWSTGDLVRRAKPRARRFDPQEYARVRAAAAEFATAVGRRRCGRFSRAPGLLWKARSPLPSLPKPEHHGHMLPEHARKLARVNLTHHKGLDD